MHPSTVNQFLADLQPAFAAGDVNATAKHAETANVAVVTKMYHAVIHGDMAGFLDGLAEDVELENIGPAAVPFVGRWKGRAELAEAIPRNFSQIEDQRPEILSVIAQGDMVAVVAREQGRYKPTGRTYETHWVQLFTIADGKVTKMRQVFDSGPFLEAINGQVV